jgi:hypothetical protein
MARETFGHRHQSRPQQLATRHLLVAALLRRYLLTAVTMHLRHRGLRRALNQAGQCAVIRDRKPPRNRQHDYCKPAERCHSLVHDASSITRKAQTFNVFLIPGIRARSFGVNYHQVPAKLPANRNEKARASSRRVCLIS